MVQPLPDASVVQPPDTMPSCANSLEQVTIITAPVVSQYCAVSALTQVVGQPTAELPPAPPPRLAAPPLALEPPLAFEPPALGLPALLPVAWAPALLSLGSAVLVLEQPEMTFRAEG
jgi:hypothetical protein